MLDNSEEVHITVSIGVTTLNHVQDNNIEEIIQNIIHDDEINKKRNMYYRPNLE